ncbi:MAG TPA: FtsX-like permease family protein, partial [Chryseolinea sp.]
TIAAIEKKWKTAYAPNVFGYYFLDDFFDAQYKNDQNAEVLLSALAFLAFFISSSGLFALAMYSIGGRIKEISIRKVFGASSSNLALMLGRDFLKLVVIAGLIALPLEYQGVSIWLERYAYKMPLYLEVYLIPLGAVAIFALGTISFQIFSAANRSPVKAINHE